MYLEIKETDMTTLEYNGETFTYPTYAEAMVVVRECIEHNIFVKINVNKA